MGSSTASFFVFVALIVGIQSACPAFKDCGSAKGKVENVSVNTTCNNKTGGAILKKGTVVQLGISLDSEEDTPTLKAVVHGIIAGVPVPFKPDNPDGCKGCNVSCPVQNKKHYDYASTISVLSQYPSIRLLVKWELKDAQDKDVACVIIPAQIES